MMSSDSPTELVRRAAAGDDAAFTVLLSQHEPQLRARLARRIPQALVGAIDVDDVLQESYADVFCAINRFVPASDDAFARWLSTVVLRRLRAIIRWHAAEMRGGKYVRRQVAASDPHESTITLLRLIEASDSTPSRQVARQECVNAVRTALDSLPQDYQDVIRLVYLEGCGISQAAQVLKRTEGAVRNICHRAKERLRQLVR